MHIESVCIAVFDFHFFSQFEVSLKSYVCSERKKNFTRENVDPMVVMYLNVEKHCPFQEVSMRAINNGEKSKKCNQCDYTSSWAASLRTHLKTHSGEKTNKCSQCEFASFRPDYLRSHMKKHFADKSNKCNQCDFASSYARALKTHLKIHIGMKTSQELRMLSLSLFIQGSL